MFSFSIEQIAQCSEKKIGSAFLENKLIRSAEEWRRQLPKYSESKAKVTAEKSPFYRGKGGILFANGTHRNLNFLVLPQPHIYYWGKIELSASLGQKVKCYLDLPQATNFDLAFTFSLGIISESRHVYALILGFWPIGSLTEQKSFHVKIELEESRWVYKEEFKSITVRKAISHDRELLIRNQIVVPFTYSVGCDKRATIQGKLFYKCDAYQFRAALSHIQLVQLK